MNHFPDGVDCDLHRVISPPCAGRIRDNNYQVKLLEISEKHFQWRARAVAEMEEVQRSHTRIVTE
eukprot:5603447-Prorocentrum_lima.AAC.1